MISISINDVKAVIKLYSAEIAAEQVRIKKDLVALEAKSAGDEKLYIGKLIKCIDKIITDEPSELKKHQKIFDKVISPVSMASKGRKKFRNTILNMLGYTTNRTIFYPKYFEKIGIKSCVYCNSLLAITVKKVKKTAAALKVPERAKFQVDHFLSKNEYPCFGISLFNLYPTCANCNNIKSTKNIFFDLYLDQLTHQSPFYFRFTPSSRADYLLSRDIEDIELNFEEPAVKKGFQTFNDVFDIDGIYRTQRDVAEELILKAEVYTPAYKKSLQKSLPQIFSSPDIIDRLLIGNYTSPSDIHKRPLTKFTIDICEQVGLIPKSKP